MHWGNIVRDAPLRAAWLSAAISCTIVLAAGCRQSLVRLGDALPQASDASAAMDEGPADAAASIPDSGGGVDAHHGEAGARAGAGSGPDVGGSHAGAGGDVGMDAGAVMAADSGTLTTNAQPRLPQVHGDCPTLQNGHVRFDGIDVQLWLGPELTQPGPLLIYWHGTGSTSLEASGRLGTVHGDILAAGGVIAALAETTGLGMDTSTGTWHIGDIDIADAIVACVSRDRAVDATRIYSAGCSSGGIQAAAFAYQRSSYIAAVMLDSGGVVQPFQLDDPTHPPALIAAHGRSMDDVVIIDFAEATHALAQDLAARGGFAVTCEHMNGHCGASNAQLRAGWEFLQAHRYGVRPSPYEQGLPASFPSQCQIVSP